MSLSNFYGAPEVPYKPEMAGSAPEVTQNCRFWTRMVSKNIYMLHRRNKRSVHKVTNGRDTQEARPEVPEMRTGST